MRVIDLMHRGRPHAIGAWLDGDVLVDCGPASTLETLLAGLGETRPSALLLTHVHLDHAAGAGALVARWPELPVYVHERGVRHLADPTRLVDSARRVYGDEMRRLWGVMEAVPQSNLHALSGGETILDRYEVAATPGHASHHVCFRRADTVFAGDVAGVRIVPGALTLPPTPPPDIDVDAWCTSLDLVSGWSPRRLALTHFGVGDEPAAQLRELRTRLLAWAQLARDGDRERFIAVAGEEIQRDDAPEQAAAYGSPEGLAAYYAGLARYWSRRESPRGQTDDSGALSSP
jgi:glyoxylase-like metal-dependent hydrolase (beta-lactamase superfamily II)